MSLCYTCAPKITIVWCMVPGIEKETDNIFCHFGSFFALLPPPNYSEYQNFEKTGKKMLGDTILLYIHVYHKWRSYDIWFLKRKVRPTEIFDILGHFLPFDKLENQNFNIEKHTWKYHYFTHLQHKWQSYDAWFLKYWEWPNLFVILARFLALLPHLKTWKIKILKN